MARLGDNRCYRRDAAGLSYRTLDPAVRKQALGDPTLMAKLVRAELARMAVLKEAEARKWDQRPEVVQEIQRVRDEAITSSYLMSVSAPPADYPSEADIQSAYDLNRDALMRPRQYRLSQIFVALPTGRRCKAEAAARARRPMSWRARRKFEGRELRCPGQGERR